MENESSKQHPDQAGALEIVDVAGRNWIAGLVWRSFASYPTLSERREDAQALDAEWIILRQSSEIIQAGFCSSIKNRNPKKLYSLAAAVAEEYQQPWCGVFKLNEKSWWYIAVRDGQAILPDGDVVGSHAKVRRIQKNHEYYGDWNVHEGTLEDLTPLLEFSKKNLRMGEAKSVEPTPIWKVFASIFIVLALIVGGIAIYLEHKYQVHQEAEKALHEMVLNNSPLKTTPLPNDWLESCLSIIEPLPISKNGWLADKVSCTGNQANIIWERLDSTTILSRPVGILSKDGNQVVQSQYFRGDNPGQDVIKNYNLEDDDLYRILQPIGVQAEIGNPDYGSTAGIEVQTVSFTLPFTPLNIDFDDVPGFRINALNWADSGWVVQGKLYGR